ncbi:MAG: ABC transporter substrate-binding protein [Deltaproteobacteria bacterium]|jgi:ABC-type uncharacterized transport system substrate-binding protein|nr:ABC transporter substrate-binding protein [Deltaproteobacteria bacterium]
MLKALLHFCCLPLIATWLVIVTASTALAATASTDFAATAAMASAAPEQPEPGKPWRIAVVASGPYTGAQAILQGFAERLAELGIISNGDVPVPENTESIAPMWQWLAQNAGNGNLVFVPDAFYSPEWDPALRQQVKQNFLERVRSRGDIDCVLAFDTWAGQDIGLADLAIPVLVLDTTDAVSAGIIPSTEDSGRDNLLAVTQSGLYSRQVQIFHELLGFSKLGIVYEDTPAGRGNIALKEIEAAVQETGVELLRCTSAYDLAGDKGAEAADADADVDAVAERLRACHEELVRQGADAIYLTYPQSVDSVYNAYSLEPLLKAGIPTFAQQGSSLVKRGALLSLASRGIDKGEGAFAAEALEKIMNGSLPRYLSQRYESLSSLAVNLHTATIIGWNLPMEILAAVDEIYRGF